MGCYFLKSYTLPKLGLKPVFDHVLLEVFDHGTICYGSVFNILLYFYTTLWKLIGQMEDLSNATGELALWMIPQLFAYAMNFPIAKILQSQSKMMVTAYISAMALALHTFFSWLFVLKLGWRLARGAIVLNLSWWFIVVTQLIYTFSGICGQAWSGFSWSAFHNLWAIVRLSLASAVMLCLEVLYYVALVLFAGYVKRAEIAVDAFSIWYFSFSSYNQNKEKPH